jgi:hypothetical protein
VSIKIPAVAASLLLAGTIGAGSAHAAKAYTDQPQTIAGEIFTTGRIGAGPGDSCLVSWRMHVYGGQVGDPIAPIFSGSARSANLCTSPYARHYEDGSITIPVAGNVVPVSRLVRHHRYLMGVTVCSFVRGAIGCHTTFRSFWPA